MYGKIFASLYDGTMRGKAHAILVFTNLIACADRHGYVDKHWRAISEEVGLTVDEVKAAIAYLEAPDPESRSAERDGARLQRLDAHRAWGWRIVNYVRYREIRAEEDRREQNRQAKARARSRQHVSADVSTGQHASAHVSIGQHESASVSTSQHASAMSAHAEGEAEGEAEEEAETPASLAPPPPPPREQLFEILTRQGCKTSPAKLGEWRSVMNGPAWRGYGPDARLDALEAVFDRFPALRWAEEAAPHLAAWRRANPPDRPPDSPQTPPTSTAPSET